MKIAWIGTGVMGAPMASHLAEAGHEVTVYNRSRAKAEALAPRCRVAETIEEAVRGAEVVFTIVGFVKDVEEVYLGEKGILASATPGTVICDMTTSSPKLAVRIAEEATKRGLVAVDAPVTGGDLGAKQGTLSIMVGGEKSAYEKLLPLLEKLGKAITYMGEAGTGQHAKLANQMAIAGAIAGCAEALSYAGSHGLHPEAVLRVINNGSAASWQSQNMGAKMLSEDYAPGFYIKHFMKDLRLGQEERGEMSYPLAREVLAHYEALTQDAAYLDYGTQAIIDYYKKQEK